MIRTITMALLMAAAGLQAASPDSVPLKTYRAYKSDLISKRLYMTGSFGQNSTTSLGVLWGLKRKSEGKLNFYLGARVNYKRFNVSELFVTAPAILTTGKEGFPAVFAAKIPENMDTLTFSAGSILAGNLSMHINYKFYQKLGIRFQLEANLDVVGLSFGPSLNGNFVQAGKSRVVGAKPSGFNLFLLGDNNRGSLNSEFLIRLGIDKMSVHAGLGVSMWEQSTHSPVQPGDFGGNDRFRLRSAALVVGGRYRF